MAEARKLVEDPLAAASTVVEYEARLRARYIKKDAAIFAKTQHMLKHVDEAADIAKYEAFLKKLSNAGEAAIRTEAEYMLKNSGNVADIAKWTHNAREALKLEIRKLDFRAFEEWAKSRNITKYGRAEGPTLDQLRARQMAKGAKTIQEADLKIITKSSERTSGAVNKTLRGLRIAGRICIIFEISMIGYEVYEAPVVDRPKVFIEGVGGLAGAIAGGWAGAELGGWGGAGVGVWFGGIGAAPGAIGGAIIGGIGGAIAGGISGRAAAKWAAEQLYPTKETYFEDFVFSK
jgi:hypothetical protein